MTDRKLTDGWPYIILDVLGVRLPFRQLGMPGARVKAFTDMATAQAEGLDLVRAAQADDATDHDRAQMDRAALLVQGSVGAYLMRLWAGPRMPTQDLVDADKTAEPADLHFKGADHREAAGLAFASDLCDHYGVAYEHLTACARILSEARAPGPADPTGDEVAEVVRLFPSPKEATT